MKARIRQAEFRSPALDSMNISAASLASSLAQLQSTFGSNTMRHEEGPLTLQAEISAANVQARSLLADPTLSPACRAVIERLASLTDALARHHGCLHSEHEREGVAADLLVDEVEEHLGNYAGNGTRMERITWATRLLKHAESYSELVGARDQGPPEAVARDLFERVQMAKGDVGKSWDGMDHSERRPWIVAVTA